LIPRTLSASSIATFESCPARWKAEVLNYGKQINNSAASLGTAVHAVCEQWVKGDHYKVAAVDAALVTSLYDTEYYKLFADAARYAEGLKLCLDWVARTDWSDREVLSAETKSHFDIKIWNGVQHVIIPVNYIWDRCDKLILPNGTHEIEVVDYKTVSQPVTSDQMKVRVQPRIYALAAQIAFPEVERIWVTFDLLRFDQVSVAFSKAENAVTWKYVNDVAARIVAASGWEEKLNNECRFCIRNGTCRTLASNLNAGGIVALNDPVAATEQRANLSAAVDGAKAVLDEIDTYLLAHMENEDITELDTPTAHAEATVYSKRTVDPEQVARGLGAEVAKTVFGSGTITIAAVDKALKGNQLTADQKIALKKLIHRTPSSPRIKTTIK
jgi:RecB family exonuclease